ncbi:MAG: hypothetical protein CL623_01980 [Arcobacter sp.]|nr:hypothetical protein [Arcobacter sp.]|tara:strand:- start:8066 stop:8410 length:345 start_codon:yes stop_codon:yes gene_type:complete
MKHFDISEFDCKETGENKMDEKFLKMIDKLREVCGFPFIITSGFRSVNHSAEINKPNGGGTHTKGIAADIAVSGGAQRMEVVKQALSMGFSGVGVANGFVHVDIRDTTPVMWVY